MFVDLVFQNYIFLHLKYIHVGHSKNCQEILELSDLVRNMQCPVTFRIISQHSTNGAKGDLP